MTLIDKHNFKRIILSMQDLLFPRKCIPCEQRLTLHEKFICVSCLRDIPLVNHTSFIDNPMARLFWGTLPVERSTAYFYYHRSSAFSRILFEMKYNGHPQVGYTMGCIMARHLLQKGFFEGIDAIIPVPLSAKRKRQRGYNQCDFLAQGVSSVTTIPLEKKCLLRAISNPTQTRLGRMERRKNVEGIFQLKHPEYLSGKHILLLDDVLTTGATVFSCGKTLSSIPNIKISILSLALASRS